MRATRSQLSVLAVVAIGVLGLLIVVAPAPPAAAQQSWQGDVQQNCDTILGLPGSLMGTVTGGGVESALVGGGLAAPVMSSGAGASTVASGGALASGASVAAYIGTAFLGFCAGFNGAAWVTGQDFRAPGGYTGPSMQLNTGNCIQYVATEGMEREWPLPGGSEGQCIGVAIQSDGEILWLNQFYDTGGSPNNYTYQSAQMSYNFDNGSGWETVAGSSNTVYRGAGFGPSMIIELDCRSETLCAVKPHRRLSDGRLTTMMLQVDKPGHSGVLAQIPITHPTMEKGETTRYWSRSGCWSAEGAYSEVTWKSSWGNASDRPNIDVPQNQCPSGWVPSSVEVFEQVLGMDQKTSASRTQIPDLDDIPLSGTSKSRVDYPSLWRSNPTLRQCYVEGFTNCEATSADGVTTITNTVTNQTTNVTVANPTTTVGTAVNEITTGLQVDPNPTTTVSPNPSTTVAPTTTTTTTPGGGDPVPPQDPPPPPPPPDEGDNQWATCMNDQAPSDWSEVTYNPITWVRAIVYYVTAPIICALWWLVVPPGGFGSLLDVFSEAFDDSPLIASLSSIADGFVWNAGCAPVDFGDPMGASGPSLGVIDVGMCGNLVIALVWTIILGLAVISMAGDLVRTIWTYGQYRKVGFI